MNIKMKDTPGITRNGVFVTPAALKPRPVLALLALPADHVLSVASLAEEVRGPTPPRSARTAPRACVLHRREPPGVAPEQGPPGHGVRCTTEDVLVTLPGGCLPDRGDGTGGVRQFERLASAGRRAMGAGSPGRGAPAGEGLRSADRARLR